MNTTDKPFESYVFAIREQAEQHLAGLDELRTTLSDRPLTFNERNSAMRSLQVLVEIAIGCSKHYLKASGKPVPSEARSSIERVYELLAITDPDISVMRGATGMRNAIIHDYLNLDWVLIERVMRSASYRKVETYIMTVSERLLAMPG